MLPWGNLYPYLSEPLAQPLGVQKPLSIISNAFYYDSALGIFLQDPALH